jgi:Endosomal/lysosomal potassium channel TMEM175
MLALDWHKILVFLLSFVVVGLYWAAHNQMMRFVVTTDRILLWLNLLLASCHRVHSVCGRPAKLKPCRSERHSNLRCNADSDQSDRHGALGLLDLES